MVLSAVCRPCRCRRSWCRRWPRRSHPCRSTHHGSWPPRRRSTAAPRPEGRAARRSPVTGPWPVERQLQPALRNDLPRQRGTLPGQLGHRPAGVLVPFHADGVDLARDQIDLGSIVGGAVIGPVVDDQPAVEPQPHAVIAGGDELKVSVNGASRLAVQRAETPSAETGDDSPRRPAVVDRAFGRGQHRVAGRDPCP